MALRLSFDRGTLVLEGAIAEADHPEGFLPDPRAAGRLRAPGIEYRRAMRHLIRAGYRVEDAAQAYEKLDLKARRDREPYPHQSEALDAWHRSGKRGTVVLPTGSGKSYVAELAIAAVSRSTLVVVPTLDLMNQWMTLLKGAFGPELVGAMGGGMHDIRPLTVTTYDSAYIHMDRLGAQFGLLVFDECHHLPGPTYAQSAELSIAPFRLGLTATPEREDEGEARMAALIGPIVYRREIQELSGEYLADYEVVRLRVELNADERARYDSERARYRAFVASEGIRLGGQGGWREFLARSSRSAHGRRALRAWREHRRIQFQCEGKLDALGEILTNHPKDPLLVFTNDNDTVYSISRRFLIPAITHQTPTAERQAILAGFNAGTLNAIVTSRVLNEGVDMPAAQVGVVLSGTATVREHVQRLGRILRRQEGKRAVLYEVISGDTGEERASERRREHGAYR